MSCRIALLAAFGIGLGLANSTRADLAPPLPQSKDSVKVKIELDENAKGPRLIVPNGVFTAPRGRLRPDAPPKGELPQDNGDGIAQDEGQPRNQILIAGVALSLAFAFGGLWFIRRGGRGSGWSASSIAGADRCPGPVWPWDRTRGVWSGNARAVPAGPRSGATPASPAR